MGRSVGRVLVGAMAAFLVLAAPSWAVPVTVTKSNTQNAVVRSAPVEFGVSFASTDFPAAATVTKVVVTLDFAHIDDTGSETGPTCGPPPVNGTLSERNDEMSYALRSPAGTTVAIIPFGTYQAAGYGGRVAVTLDDAATSSLGGVPSSGTFQPRAPLSTFNGQAGLGAWTLVAQDTGFGDPLCHYGFSLALTVDAPTGPPVAVDDAYATSEDTVLNVAAAGVLGNDTDPDGNALTASLVSGPAHGSLTLNGNGSFSYTPAVDYNGPDSFTYRANDGASDSNVATVSITVNPVNDAPIAVNDAYSTNEDIPLAVAAPGVLANDADVDGDALTASLVTGPSHGTLTLNANGSFTYTPAANYNGPDSFSYRANDGTASSNTATVSITVNPVNDAPTVTVAAGGACGANDRSGTINLTVADPDTSAASLTLSGASNNQALVPNPNLSFAGAGVNRTLTAAAAARHTGTATITVTVSDGSATGTVTVTLRASGNGKDTLAGTGGADMLFGQNGKDTLAGQAGNDLLCGGRGKDRLTGGTGADHFGGGLGTDTATDLTATEGDTQDGTISFAASALPASPPVHRGGVQRRQLAPPRGGATTSPK